MTSSYDEQPVTAHADLQFRLALTANESILCSVHNSGYAQLSILHSPKTHHVKLMVFDNRGRPVPYSERTDIVSTKDQRGTEVEFAPHATSHLSHSRIVFAEDGSWGLSWGPWQYRELEPGIYTFLATHPEVRPSCLTKFEITQEPGDQ